MGDSVYSRSSDVYEIPRLNSLQHAAYREFLQADIAPGARKSFGLEQIFRETFPIKSHDGKITLDYVSYRIDPPVRAVRNCRDLGLSFGCPFRIKVRAQVEDKDSIEEEIFVGEIPELVGGGEFIVNGVERTVVIQVQRSPGADFSHETSTTGKKVHTARIIPERGSWLELEVGSKDILFMRIDKSGKVPATVLLRAISGDEGDTKSLLSQFYDIEEYDLSASELTLKKDLTGAVLIDEIVDAESGDVLFPSLSEIKETAIKNLAGKGTVSVIRKVKDPLILETVRQEYKEYEAMSSDDAAMYLFARLRPSTPGNLERARELVQDRFLNPVYYNFGKVGRFRLNRKFDENIPEDDVALRAKDISNVFGQLLMLRSGAAEVDDIDHLGNRRIRTIANLVAMEFRSGLWKMKRSIQEKMNLKMLRADAQGSEDLITPRALVNTQPLMSALDYFFARGELSQVVDQTNPLSQLAHERRVSALGPGGLNRKRAGFEVRDVHTSHYGRICAIETPEGANIGLIMQLSLYARINEYGFLVTPYRKVKDGQVTNDVVELMADEEQFSYIVPGDTELTPEEKIKGDFVLARINGDYESVETSKIEYMDVSSQQTVGLAASLIPFLEHDDANRALMGSNMQRQAVPLMAAEVPVVGTGMESQVAQNSSMCVRTEEAGVVSYADSKKVVVNDTTYELEKLAPLNDKSALNQKPIVKAGDEVTANEVIADGPSMKDGELALGKNVLVGFLSWKGNNFEDAIIVSEELVRSDTFTSIHIVEQSITVRETKLGMEEVTRDIPNLSDMALASLDEDGLIAVGTYVKPGDILVGKISPKSKTELSSEERLLHAIFGRAGEDVKNDSLTVKPGIEGYVVDVRRFRRKVMLMDEEKASNRTAIKKLKEFFMDKICEEIRIKIKKLIELFGTELENKQTGYPYPLNPNLDGAVLVSFHESFDLSQFNVDESKRLEAEEMMFRHDRQIAIYTNKMNIEEETIKRGDYLPHGVLEKITVYIAQKYTLEIGDKMAGRHGNKGVISRVLPIEDMPYLDDGTPIQIILNPLGVPSRMNYGQILETHLGWAMKKLGTVARYPVFDSLMESEIIDALEKCGIPRVGKVKLTDGMTGDQFDQNVTVGYIYMLKLHHLVRDKLHARATGPYSLITQQPLGGKARMGGQRLGEMEVWALEAHGSATVLQEFLTVKSDDIIGRSKIYDSMVNGDCILEPGTPQSLSVLLHEIRGLCLNIRLTNSDLAGDSLKEQI
ncbi:MAG: DNA-directed RNA polymerase subunit beta [Planctomycetes bacterium]|nr:DNA-directed RNA polymerase subunit beta [Planctomycetota bacterium]